MDVSTIVGIILGGGGVTFLGAMFKGAESLRSGARAREREAIDDLGRQRDDADERYRWAALDSDFWCRIQARYAAQLLRAGIEPDPADPVPPSRRAQPSER